MRYILILILFILVGCSPASTYSETENHQKVCLPNIKSQGDWIAADGGRSIPLPNNTFIHLFGDTLLSDPGQFVGNSIGLAFCDGEEYSVTYHIDMSESDSRQAFFVASDEFRMWPVDGIYHNEKLYITLANIINVKYYPGFDYAGSTLAIIQNPLDNPSQWIIKYEDFSAGYLRPTKGMVIHNNYIYIYGIVEGNNNSAILMRVPLNNIKIDSLEYLSKNKQYKNIKFYNDDVLIILKAPPAFYVSKYGDFWISIHNGSEFGSDEIVLRISKTLEGPWSEEIYVHDVPEVDRNDVICYAGTEHPQLRVRNSLVATYSCNTLTGNILNKEIINLYLPKTILINNARELINVQR